jgi:GT2 family glycosyltransferase
MKHKPDRHTLDSQSGQFEDQLRVLLLVVCFDRVGVTLRNLRQLFDVFDKMPSVDLKVFLVDDASPDGTGDAVRSAFPQIEVINGSGHLWWNGGMCAAYDVAKSSGPSDAYLLFNDDLWLEPDGVAKCLETFRHFNLERPTIVVGPTLSADRKTTTFSAYIRSSPFRPLNLARLLPNGAPRFADTFNGNFVLVPKALMDKLGGPDPQFHQHFGDLDLGFRAQRLGAPIVLCGQHVGVCDVDAPRPLSFRRRLAGLFGPPTPLSDYAHFVFNHAAWPVAAVLSVRFAVFRILNVLVPKAKSPVTGPMRPREIE